MKLQYSRFITISTAAVLLTLPSFAWAATHFKDSTGTDINTLANWSTTNGAATPDPLSFGTADQLRFNENTAATGTFTMDLSTALTVGDITVDSGTGTGGVATGNFVIDSASNSTLTLNGGGNPSYTTSGIVMNSSAGGTLTLNCDLALGANPVRFTTSRALTVNGDIALGANTLEFNTAGSTTTLSGIISGTGGLNKALGGQILALTNTANSFSGAVTLVGGTTQVAKLAIIGNNSSLGTGSGVSQIALNGASLTYTGAGADTTNRVIEMRAGATINNTGSGTISFTAANVSQTLAASVRTMTLGGTNAGDNTFGSILGDSGIGANITSLTKSGAGKWILTGSNTYTGATNVNAGTLALGNATNTIADTANITVNGGILDIGANSDTVGAVTLTTGSITGTSGTLTASSYAVSAGTISASLGGAGTLTKSGAGTVILSGTNSYLGATTISAGTLSVGATANLGAAASNLVLDGGILQITGNTLATVSGIGHTVSFNATKTVGLDINNAAHTFTVDQILDQTTGGFTKLGTGAASLTQANTYTGTTFVYQGALNVTGSGVLGGASGSTADANNIVFGQNLNSGALQFETVTNLGAADQIRFRNTAGGTDGQGGALVYIGTTNQTLSKTIQCDTSIGIRLESNSVGGSLTFNGAFSQTNRRIYLGGSGTGDNTLATPFGGNGGITKRDAGTWILTGTNNYSGTTFVTGGTLALGHATDTLSSTSAVSIGSATLATAVGVSDTVGTLDPTAAATIHIGSGATLAFAKSDGIDWTDGTLNITGTFVPGNLGSLRFGDNLNQPGLTGDQLLKITAAGFTGFGLDADGYLTAIPAAGFSAWAAANAPGQTIDQDHDNDGVSNGVEYFMGLSGNAFTANPGVDPSTRIVSWPKGASYTGTYGTHYAIQISSDLGIGDPWADVPIADVTIDGDSVDYDLDTAPAGTRKFARLKVTGP